jgi:hypothetical protein
MAVRHSKQFKPMKKLAEIQDEFEISKAEILTVEAQKSVKGGAGTDDKRRQRPGSTSIR